VLGEAQAPLYAYRLYALMFRLLWLFALAGLSSKVRSVSKGQPNKLETPGRTTEAPQNTLVNLSLLRQSDHRLVAHHT